MQKIMFNDRYGLTQAVIEGRKTMTRRIIKPQPIDVTDAPFSWVGWYAPDGSCRDLRTHYKVGEIVAVAQRYKDAGLHPNQSVSDKNRQITAFASKGWVNKMFVRADLMPHQIRITGVRAERLQDITDEDCLREGIYKDECKTYFNGYAFDSIKCEGGHVLAKRWYKSPKEAFASLIDRVSGKCTWERNPWVWAYEFELVK